MKEFLRYAACLAAMLLLTVCPVKALAADAASPAIPDKVGVGEPSKGGLDDEGGTQGGKTTFGILDIGKWHFLTVKAMDGVTGEPVSGVTVQLYPTIIPPPAEAGKGEAIPLDGTYPEPSPAPSAEVPEYVGITDTKGEARFKYPKETTEYLIQYIVNRPGFEAQTDPVILNLPYKYNVGEIKLVPQYVEVRYHATWPGVIPSGEETEKVRWGTAPKHPPTNMVPPDQPYAFSHWTLDGKPVDLSTLKLTDVDHGIDLYAQFVRQYRVTYQAGKHGRLEGSLQEMVTVGEKPKAVPAAIPLTKDDWFVRWQLAGDFAAIDPSSVVIKKDTTFEAIFDVRRVPTDVIWTPSYGKNPNGTSPESTSGVPAEGSSQGEGQGGNQGGGQGDGQGGGQGNGQGNGQGGGQGRKRREAPGFTSSSQSAPSASSGQEESPGSSQPEGTQAGHPEDHPGVPASIHGNSNSQSRQLWLILLLCLLTLFAGWRRLLGIRREARSFGGQEEEKGKKPGSPGQKAIAAEVIAGIFCAGLWGTFFVRRTGSWDLAALALWGAILLSLAALLIRSEYRLRHRKDQNQP